MAVSCPPSTSLPAPSALQKSLDSTSAKSPLEALPLEILHNLRHQHNWTNLQLLKPHPTPKDIPSLNLSDRFSSRSHTAAAPTLLSGIPPKPIYTHPSHQSHLVLQALPLETHTPQIEYVLPLSLGQSFTLRLLQAAFDAIPARDAIEGADGFRHQDAKRLLLAMRGRQGMGGDGTVNYYIVQEGEVKPRQN